MSDLTATPVQVYLLACVATSFIAGTLGRLAWQRRETPGATEVALYLGIAGTLTLLGAGNVIQTTVPESLPFLQAYMALLMPIGVLWLTFSLRFAGHEDHVTRRRLLVVSLPPLIGALSVLTNAAFGLGFSHATLETEGAFTLIDVTPSTLYLAVTTYQYVLIAVGFTVLLRIFLRSRNVSRRQIAVILLGAIFPSVAGVLDVTGSGFVPHLNLLPLAFGVNGVFLFWGLFGENLLRLQPIARDVIVDEMVDAAIVVDEDGTVVDLNPAAESLFAVTATAAVGTHLEAVHPSFDDSAWLLRGDPGQLTLDRGDSTTILDPRHSTLTDHKDRMTAHLLVFRDVTEREQMVVTLRERERELRAQNERLDTFASVVSHDIRNPLQVLHGSLDLAEQTGDSAHFDRSRRSVQRIQGLVDDLLALAREGELVDTVEPVSLPAVVAQCQELVDTSDATLTNESNLELLADAGRLQQLLENLLRNAIEHGGRDVEITVGDLPDGTGFYVADDGLGIPAGEHEQVFQTGYTSLAEGTGIGLAIVDEIASGHGWTVTATDGPRGGARFEITTSTGQAEPTPDGS
jgi:signal transduction histidine kinase